MGLGTSIAGPSQEGTPSQIPAIGRALQGWQVLKTTHCSVGITRGLASRGPAWAWYKAFQAWHVRVARLMAVYQALPQRDL